MENFSLGLNVYGSHLYVSKYFICWSSVCPWALGKGKGMPIAQYLLPENSNIFSDQIHFCNKCAIDPSESILLQLVTANDILFLEHRSTKNFLILQNNIRWVYWLLVSSPSVLCGKITKKNPVYFPFLSGFINLNMLEKVCIFLKPD